jgi:hypothetical protein
MKRSLVLVTAALALPLVVVSACRATQPASGVEAAAAEPSFVHLQQLVGGWKCTTAETHVVDLAYRLVSAGSTLVETFTTASGKETLTIFHADGPHLLATHYCAQGNQPRLRLRQASGRTFDFRFHDATNLAGPAASHLARLELELIDADHSRRTEIYVADGKEETARYECERVH